MNKRCPMCKETKTLDCFCKDKNTISGLHCYCRTCVGKKTKAYHERNREKRLIQMRAWHYDITAEALAEMEKNQPNGCMICGVKTNGKMSFHIDHDHITGIVRDLLCTRCNTLIGFSHGQADVLRKASDYLERWNAIPR